MTPHSQPLVCNMTDAPDTPEERVAEYSVLFGRSLIGRERTPEGIRFRFSFEPGLEDQIRDLAGREKACCPFFTFSVARQGEEIVWDSSVIDDDLARQILDEYYRLPDTAHEGTASLFRRFAVEGLNVVTRHDGATS